MSALKLETIAIGATILVGGYMLLKLGGKASQFVDNAQNHATDASGAPVTAYQGAGALGAAGGVANAASGGYLASFGNWIGSSLFDLTHSDPMATAPINPAPPSTSAANDKYMQGGNAASGSGSVDLFQDPAMFGWNWGG